MTEKDPATYLRILHEHEVRPDQFLMVGNSVQSDVLPVLAIGARAVHIPYEYLWAEEHAEHDGSVPELASISELPGWLAGTGTADAEPDLTRLSTRPLVIRAGAADLGDAVVGALAQR